jgi:hypothetical protein
MKNLLSKYQDKYVLCCGGFEVMQSYGYKKLLTVEELWTLYPTMFWANHWMAERGERLEKLTGRMGKSEEQLKGEMEFGAVMVLDDTPYMELRL